MMKNLKKKTLAFLTLGLTLSTSLASAANFKLAPTDTSLSPLHGHLKEVSRLCPEGHFCITDGTNLTVEYALKGCRDRLGPVSYKAVHQADQSVDIFISALNVHDKRSTYTDCIQLPRATQTIPFINKFYSQDQIRLHFLGLEGTRR